MKIYTVVFSNYVLHVEGHPDVHRGDAKALASLAESP